MMDAGAEESSEVLSEIVKASAVYLANLLINQDDIFSTIDTTAKVQTPSPDQIKALYLHAYTYADPSSAPGLRISGIRLLAALFATKAPPLLQSEADFGMEKITVRSLYKLLTTPAPDNVHSIEQIFVTVGALKALTRNGESMDGIAGIVAWLIKALDTITDEWMQWCSSREEGIPEWSEKTRVSHVRGDVST